MSEEQQPNPETNNELGPRIYVASLSDYNAGRLHGAWIDAARDVDELQEDIATMLGRSPEPIAEEWAIHDYEGFSKARLSEYEDLRTVSILGRGIHEYGSAFAAWFSILERSLEDSDFERFQDAYFGTWNSVEDYAEEYLDGIGARAELEQIPEWLQPYVKLDIEGFARDLVMGGDISVVEDEDGVHVFDGMA